MRFLTLITLLLIISSCERRVSDEKKSQEETNYEKEILKRIIDKKQQKEIEKLDSLRLKKVLEQALNFGKKSIKSNSFKRTYETLIDDSTSVKVEIKLGKLFSNNYKHMIICRTSYEYMYFDIFKIDKEHITHVLEFKNLQSPDFSNHAIKDVNGDGFNDFIVHWYPNSGCCRRNILDVYLNTGNGSFTKQYEFINPTFSVKEKVIRGVLYGHPGEVGLYKYKWNGLKVDTIEFIYPDESDTLNRHYIKTNRELYSSKNVKQIKLKSIPKEYKTIDSFDWFNNY